MLRQLGLKSINWRTKVGMLIVFLGGVILALKGGIAEPFDANSVYLGITTAGGAFAGWGATEKVQRWMRSKGID